MCARFSVRIPLKLVSNGHVMVLGRPDPKTIVIQAKGTRRFWKLRVDGAAVSRYTPPSVWNAILGFPEILPNCFDDRSQ